MKKMIFVAIMALASSSFAEDIVLKDCSVSVKIPDASPIQMDMILKVIKKSDNSLASTITQTLNGNIKIYDDVADISEGIVRENLTSKSDVNELNAAEELIVHSMTLEEEPSFQHAFLSGIDLKKVRSAKMYRLGKAEIGSVTIIEARDADNQILGSFLGGFILSPCK
ncbi:MAG TPA: hypothetical protein VN132_14080 [Bdellovibrio sp.]|nr:hypothetical protein [Bdellovibrio sp.]